MSTLLGYILLIIGAIGMFGSYTLLSNTISYESDGILLFVASTICAVAGLLIIVFSITKKKNEDYLNNLINTNTDNTRKGTCPKCGLNLANGLTICPKCKIKIKTGE